LTGAYEGAHDLHRPRLPGTGGALAARHLASALPARPARPAFCLPAAEALGYSTAAGGGLVCASAAGLGLVGARLGAGLSALLRRLLFAGRGAALGLPHPAPPAGAAPPPAARRAGLPRRGAGASLGKPAGHAGRVRGAVRGVALYYDARQLGAARLHRARKPRQLLHQQHHLPQH
nr:hypothetical protein [Tanacetum cinerariifolium]